MYLYLLGRENRENQINGPSSGGGRSQDSRGPSQNSRGRSQNSEILVREALRDYSARQGLNLPDHVLTEAIVDREANGKPFFRGLAYDAGKGIPSVHFSISHSGNWWGCLMGAEPVGFDLEVCRDKVDYLKIARRFFSKEEYELVCSGDSDTFFDVWVRKEAFIKYTGAGLGEGLSSFSVAVGGKYTDEVIPAKNGSPAAVRPCFIRSCKISDGVRAAYCSGSGDPINTVIRLDIPSTGEANEGRQ